MKYLKFLLILSLGMFMVSCNKSDSEIQSFPALPYSQVAPIDDAQIQTFFDKYHINVDPSTYDVSFVALPTTNPPLPDPSHVSSIREQYPSETQQNNAKKIYMSGVLHYAYYINFRSGDVSKKPTLADSIHVCYRGRRIDKPEYTFDNHETTPVWFGGMRNLVAGWRAILPIFGTCTSPITQNSDGTYNYNGYGAGVMFLPSALGYYASSVGSEQNNNYIPQYAPLIFSFKLMSLNYTDEDYDGIDSKDELTFDTTNGLMIDKDTDGDNRPDAFDVDDDDDGYLTKYEIKNPAGGYFPFSSIPNCSDGVKRHLSKACHD